MNAASDGLEKSLERSRSKSFGNFERILLIQSRLRGDGVDPVFACLQEAAKIRAASVHTRRRTKSLCAGNTHGHGKQHQPANQQIQKLKRTDSMPCRLRHQSSTSSNGSSSQLPPPLFTRQFSLPSPNSPPKASIDQSVEDDTASSVTTKSDGSSYGNSSVRHVKTTNLDHVITGEPISQSKRIYERGRLPYYFFFFC